MKNAERNEKVAKGKEMDNMARGYVVLMEHTFDPETRVAYFNDYNRAKAYLHWAWEDYYNTEFYGNPGELLEDETYHEDEYAVITYISMEMTEFRLLETEPIDEFLKINWKQYL